MGASTNQANSKGTKAGATSPFMHSFDSLNMSNVTPPPGMALLYDPVRNVAYAKAQVSTATGTTTTAPSIISTYSSGGVSGSGVGGGQAVDSVEGSGNESSASRGGGVGKSASGNSFNVGASGNGKSGVQNVGNGKGNNGEGDEAGGNAGGGGGDDDDDKPPVKCTCEKHEGHLLVNQVLPHSLRVLVQKVLKEEGSKILYDAYNACGSDGHVFWRWSVGEDGKWVSRVVEYTARFAGFMNAEPILCKEFQEIIISSDDVFVIDLNVESAQKFDIGESHTSIRFSNRICMTYEGSQKLRIKVHSRTNGIQSSDVEKAIMVRNHNFCNSLLNALKGVEARSTPSPQVVSSTATPPPGTHPQTPSPDPVPPGKRTSSLQPKTIPIIPTTKTDSPTSFLMTVDFWKTMVDNVIIAPTISAGKALGVLVPMDAVASQPPPSVIDQPPLPNKKHGKKKRQQSHTDPKTPNGTASAAPASAPTTVASWTASGFAILRSASTNTKILGLAMLAVVFGLGLTVLNIVWMAELSDRLERTLDAVKVARERNLALKRNTVGGSQNNDVAQTAPPAVAAVESLLEMRGRLLDHSQHLISSLPASLGKSVQSVDELKAKLTLLKDGLAANPIPVGGERVLL
ncbi:UNVERIFIED_CONTAM: hypothetical protein HDU68_005350 [Siphonaria sp. JEL0065]|nr:hypothetical protein HDU68_005350 [Siphonaria sp. JEL0065]